MITGAIDYIEQLKDGKIKLAGWAIYFDGTNHSPVENLTFNRTLNCEVIRTPRTDIVVAQNCGFSLVFESAEELASLYWGGLELHAVSVGAQKTIPLWKKLEGKIFRIISSYLKAKIAQPHGDEVPALDIQATTNVSNPKISLIPLDAYEDSVVQIGSVSHNGDVAIGKKGYIFLIGGSNNVMEQYRKAPDSRTLERWINLIAGREERCKALGIKFLQMIIPEKQSVVPEYFPWVLDGPTPLFSEINALLKPREYYADCYKILRDLFVVRGLDPYRRVDSHLSYFGAEAIIRHAVPDLKLPEAVFPLKFHAELRKGDLGGKFFQGQMAEYALVPQPDVWPFSDERPELKFKLEVEGRHGNTVYQWAAKKPLNNRKLLIFGNSMFERGGSPLGLSWWMSRIFAETRFVWSGGIFAEHLEEFKPHYVICQTVERFLTTVPGT